MAGSENCRFGWYPKILAFFLMAGLGLSVGSSLSCTFLEVVLGFPSEGYSAGEVAFGLWSFEHPDGHCVSYYDAHSTGGLGMGYSKWFMNSDLSWTTSRILAMASVLFGTLSSIAAWFSVLKKEPCCVDVLAYSSIITFLSEGSKFGLFFDIKFCTSNIWFDEETEEFENAKSCNLSEGSFIAISSILAYFLAMMLAVGFMTRPKEFAGEKEYNYEENSLPSWMQESVSPSTTPTSAYKDKVRRDMVQQDTETTRRSSLFEAPDDSSSVNDLNMMMSMNILQDEALDRSATNRIRSEKIPFPTATQSSRAVRKMDDMSVVTWDPY